jgi:hypothetical protein
MSMPRLATSFSASAVVPGVTVLRRIRICPSRNLSELSLSAVLIESGCCPACSSSPLITTITCSAAPTTAGSADATNRPAPTARRIGSSAPGSRNGIRPALTDSIARSLMS